MKKLLATLATLSLLLLGGVAFAGTASAWDVTTGAEAFCNPDGTISVVGTLTNNETHRLDSMDVTTFGVTKTAGPRESVTFQQNYPGPSLAAGSVTFGLTWTYPSRGTTGDSRSANYGAVSGCNKQVSVSAAPTFVDSACVPGSTTPSPDSVVAKDTKEYAWSLTGTPAPGATVTITAIAKAGYTLTGQVSWTHTYPTPAPDCRTVVTPVVPTLVGPTCDAPGSVTVPTTPGVLYTDNKDGTWTATPQEGSKFSGEQSVTFTVGVPQPQEQCGTPTAPTIAQSPSCDVYGSVTIPDVTGVDYYDGERLLTSGATYGVGPGNGNLSDGDSITAVVETGWVLTEGSTTSWPVDVAAPAACPAALVSPTLYNGTCTSTGVLVPAYFTVAKNTDEITYTVKGNVVTASASTGYVLSATEGWTVSEDGQTATYQVALNPNPVCIPPKPAPKVTVTTKTAISCSQDALISTTTTSTSTPVLVNNVWVFGKPVVKVTSSYRLLTADEYALGCSTALPHTGADNVVFFGLVGILMIICGGAALFAYRRRSSYL